MLMTLSIADLPHSTLVCLALLFLIFVSHFAVLNVVLLFVALEAQIPKLWL